MGSKHLAQTTDGKSSEPVIFLNAIYCTDKLLPITFQKTEINLFWYLKNQPERHSLSMAAGKKITSKNTPTRNPASHFQTT